MIGKFWIDLQKFAPEPGGEGEGGIGVIDTPPAEEGVGVTDPGGVPPQETMYEITVDGEISHMSESELREWLDMEAGAPIDEKLAKAAITARQKDIASSRRFTAAAEAEKVLTSVMARLQDPSQAPKVLAKAFELSGATNYEDFIAEEAIKIMDRRAMDPKDREIAELKEKQAHRDKLEEDAKQRRAEEDRQKMGEQIYQNISNALNEAKIPVNQKNVDRALFYIEYGLDRGLQLSGPQVSDLVLKEIAADTRFTLERYDGEELLSLLGGSLIQKIRSLDMSKIIKPTRTVTDPVPQSKGAQGGQGGGKRKEKVSSSEFWRRMEEDWDRLEK